jgi:hypothetical protein
MVTDEVVANLDMLGLVVLNRIMSDLDGTLIVTQEWHLVEVNTIILHGLPHPKKLSTTTRGRHILGFGGGERDTQFCFLEDQQTKDLPRNWQASEVDFLSTLSPAQSESEYPTSSKLEPFGYQRPKVGVSIKYQKTLLTAIKWLSIGEA